ncbi:MAG: YcjF family protein [Desulfatitalea sp.]|nr:YcjF family protein [Desulfatitalea sp.]
MVDVKNQEGEVQDAQKPRSEASVAANDTILRNHVLGALGVGLIPIPIIDLAALTGLQLNLVRKLAKAYDVPFSEDIVKHILATLIGSSIPVSFSRTFASLIKGIPLIGQTTGALAMPILAGATTYAVGKVFIQHFASGGTFLTFDPEKVKSYYNEKFNEGQEIAANMKKANKKSE